MAEKSIMCMHADISFIHSSLVGHLECFHGVALRSSATVSIDVQGSVVPGDLRMNTQER